MLKRTTEQVSQFFKEQDCELMDEYRGCMEDMDYRCKCGRYATTTWNRFASGKRCGYCHSTGRKKKYHIDEIREIFRKRGCEFLDGEFRGIHHKHRYKCKCGRIAEITFAGFYHQEQYCHECGLEKNRKKGHRQLPTR